MHLPRRPLNSHARNLAETLELLAISNLLDAAVFTPDQLDRIDWSDAERLDVTFAL